MTARGGQASRRWEFVVIGVVVLLDQLTKWIVQRTIPLHDRVEVIPGLLNFTHVRNTGAAFGVLDAADFAYKSLLVILLAAVALVVLAVYASRVPPEDRVVRLGLALILGGAVGNLIDRTFAGYVTDFVDFYWGTFHFWAFNIADSAITIGATVLILDMLGVLRNVSKTV